MEVELDEIEEIEFSVYSQSTIEAPAIDLQLELEIEAHNLLTIYLLARCLETALTYLQAR